MKHDLTTGTWQDDTGCPISIILVTTSDVLGGIGCLGPVRKLHCHVCHLFVMRGFTFLKEADELPC